MFSPDKTVCGSDRFQPDFLYAAVYIIADFNIDLTAELIWINKIRDIAARDTVNTE